jgi:C-terminal processing protease CtpA/Prc
MLIALLTVSGDRAAAAQGNADNWTFEQWVGQSAAAGLIRPYVMTVRGRTTESDGAEITVRSTGEGVSAGQYSHGQAGATVPAATVVGRRVTISGAIDTWDSPDGASLWMRVNGSGGPLLVDFGGDSRVRGTAAKEQRSITLPVPPDATSVEFGFRLRGRGTASVRTLRFIVGPPLDAGAPLTAEATAVLETAINHIKTEALRRERVTPELERSARLLAAGAATSIDVYPAIQYLIAKLQDGHTSFFSPAAWRMVNGTSPSAAPANRDPAVSTTGQVGYIEMPGYLGNQAEALRAYAARVHGLLAEERPNAVCGWIVDLRNNDGGNVFPMLSALKPFLGSGPLGRNVGPDGPTEPRLAGRNVDVDPPAELNVLENAWVAVLVGSRTNSAGEATAIAFRGRAQTRLFGQPTAGRTTANSAFTLPDGSGLALATSVMADRTGRVYGGRVEPDESVAAQDPRTNPQLDAAVATASAWLKRSSGCR